MTKYLLLALLILWLIYASPWSRSRKASKPKAPREPAAPLKPQPMVACAHCGVHLPQGDALTSRLPSGELSHFCSETHRLAGPRAHH